MGGAAGIGLAVSTPFSAIAITLTYVSRRLEVEAPADDLAPVHARLRKLTQAGQLVGNLLVVAKTLGEVGDDTSGERDVGRFDLHPRALEVRSYDGQQ